MHRDNGRHNRRRFLKIAGSVGIAGSFAGCSGGDGGDGGGDGGDGGGDGGDGDGGGGGDGGGDGGGGGGMDGGGEPTATTTETGMDLSELSPEEWRKEMATRAAKELQGEQINLVTATRDEEVVQRWVDAFGEEYPNLEGKVNAIQGQTTKQVDRIIREISAGNNTTDVARVLMTKAYGRIGFEELTGIPGFDALHDKLKARENTKGSIGLLPDMCSYNTEQVDQPPENYDDLLDDRFADKKIILDFTPSAHRVAQTVNVKSWDYINQLGDQDPKFTDSTFTVNQSTSEGGAQIAFRAVGLHALLWKNRGRPIDLIDSAEMSSWDQLPISLPGNDRPHPNAARLWADFQMREDNSDIQASRTGVMAVDLETNEVGRLAEPPLWRGPEDIYSITQALEDFPDLGRSGIASEFQDRIGAPAI